MNGIGQHPFNDYMVSSSQRRLWLISQQEEGSSAYHIPGEFELRGKYSTSSFDKAIREIIKRHEILRTVFRENVSEELRQVVLPIADSLFNFSYKDFTGSKQSKVRHYLTEQRENVFDLSTGPLLRAGLIRLGAEHYILHFTMHHIISDGWSMELLTREVMENYESYERGEIPQRNPLGIQYKDYSAWQQEQLTGEKFSGHQAYWQEQLSGELPVMSLSGERPRPTVQTHNGYGLSTMISRGDTEKLSTLCRDHQATLFMGLLSVLNSLLYRYTGQGDIIIGSPVAGREHSDLEDQIGFYINTLALRTRLKGSDCFNEILKNVRKVTLSAYNHQMYPFDRVVEDMGIPRDMSRSPISDIVLVLQNQFSKNDSKALSANDLITEDGKRTVKLDLHFSFTEKAEGLYMAVEFNSDIYEKTFMIRLVEHYKRLLTLLTTYPEMPVCDQIYMSAAEHHQLLEEFNSTEVIYNSGKNILELFKKAVEINEDKISLSFKDKKLNYKELNILTDKVAFYLKSHYAIEPDNIIGIKVPRSEWAVIVMLGILKSGGAYLPIDTSYPEERISFFITDSRAKLIVDEDELSSIRAFCQNDEALYEEAAIGIAPHSLAYVIYTSGSTGRPKGVMIEHGSLYNYISYCQTTYMANTDKVYKVPLFTSLSFDLTVTSIFSTLLSGGELYIYGQEETAEDILEDIFFGEKRINFLKCTPSHLEFLQGSGERRSTVASVVVGGEELKHTQVSLLQSVNRAVIIYNEYGPTETTVGCTTETIRYEADKTGAPGRIAIGRPVSNTQVYILDEYGQLVSAGITGELYIGGVQLSRGYLNREDLTAERFVSNPFKAGDRLYRTGDLGRWRSNGHIEYQGRKDDQVKVRGYRIELGEVEYALLSLPRINAATVQAREEDGNKYLVGYVVSDEQQIGEELRQQLLERLPEYMVPGYFIQLERLPVTSNGKVDKKALSAPTDKEIESSTIYMAPRTAIEGKLAEIWKDIFKTNREIGIKDSFFTLGGNSLNAILFINKLKQQGYTVRIDDVLRYPKIEELATKIVEYEEKTEKTSIQPSVIPGIYDVSYNQLMYYKGNRIIHSYGRFIFKLEKFSEEKFLNAYKRLIADVDVLRLKFSIINDKLFQEVLPADEVYHSIKIIGNATSFVDDNEVGILMHDFLKEPFNLFNGEVIKCGILCSQNEADILIAIHHIATDNASNMLIQKILLYYYLNDNEAVPDSINNYREFIFMQQNYLQTAEAKDKIQFWDNHLQSISDKRPNLSGYEIKDVILNNEVIRGKRFKKLNDYCKKQNIFISTFLLSIAYVFVSEYAYDEDFVINVVVNGQDLYIPGFSNHNVAGLFTNSLPLKFHKHQTNSTDEIVKYVQKVYLEARLNQEIPLVYIQNRFYERYGFSLSDVTTCHMNYVSEANRNNLPDNYNGYSRKRVVENGKSENKTDELSFKYYEYADGIIVEWETWSNAFDSDNQIESRHFLNKMNAVIDTISGNQNGNAEIFQEIESY